MVNTIEYSHIYADALFGEEQIASIQELKKIKDSGKHLIMVDDYTPVNGLGDFDISKFLENLKKYEAIPDVIVKESSLQHYCDKVINLLPNGRTKKSIEKYIDAKDKYPCSLFIAAWYLLRLGFLGSNGIETILGDKKYIYCEKIITILPSRYRDAEENGLEIINAIPSVDIEGRIEHIYF